MSLGLNGLKQETINFLKQGCGFDQRLVVLLAPGCGKWWALSNCMFSVCSAKQLVRTEPNVSYICSRYYRAPELIFGATDYTSQIGKASDNIDGLVKERRNL